MAAMKKFNNFLNNINEFFCVSFLFVFCFFFTYSSISCSTSFTQNLNLIHMSGFEWIFFLLIFFLIWITNRPIKKKKRNPYIYFEKQSVFFCICPKFENKTKWADNMSKKWKKKIFPVMVELKCNFFLFVFLSSIITT